MSAAAPPVEPVENAPAGDAFYTPPELAADGTPGDPIYQRRLDNPVAALGEAGENWLVLYRSDDVRGTPIAVSGIIALPNVPAPAGGYPVISWAHGTVGVADLCAPSRDTLDSLAHPMNAHPHGLLNTFLAGGWAVVMTDYEGLGTTDRVHPYLLGGSEARGVLDIVRTARHLFGDRISDRFAIVGHSQGGQAALFAAHHAPQRVPELGLVGVAAIAPANHSLGLVRAGAQSPLVSEGFAFTPMFLCGAIAGDPSIDPEQVLAAGVYRNRWPHVHQRCRAGLSLPDSWGGVLGVWQFQGGYPDDPNDHQAKFDAQMGATNPDVAIEVPIRITQAADDARIHATFPIPGLKGTDDLVTELRVTNLGNPAPADYQRYDAGVVPDTEPLGVHFATIDHDTPDLIDWLTPLLHPGA